MSELAPVLESLIAETRAGRPSVLCALLDVKGSAPQAPGAALLVRSDRTTVGTLGGGCVEAEVVRRAHKESLPSPENPDGAAAQMSFVLNHDWGWDDGLICGGKMEIGVMPFTAASPIDPYIDALQLAQRGEAASFPIRVTHESQTLEYQINLEPMSPLVIAGAGHVGQALARLAVDLDFQTTVIDDRGDYASPQRFGPRVNLIVDSIPEALAKFPITPHTNIVIVTRGHNNDQRALEAVINSPAGYLGLIGSKRKRTLIYEDLLRRGAASQAQLDKVHSPIGLDIGAVTVPEIAVSIAAELIKHRRQTHKKLIEGPFVITYP